MNFEEKKILINSYFMANFNNFPLVWMLSSASLLKKSKEELSKLSTSSMNVKRLRARFVLSYIKLSTK